MALSGPKKAAMLLMHLDPSTAAELLRSAEPEFVTAVAAELSYLSQPEQAGKIDFNEPIKEFFRLLYGQNEKPGGDQFVKEILQGVLGERKSQDVIEQVNERVQARDPFRHVRSAEVGDIFQALSGESAQVVTIVLSELPSGKSAELLGMLDVDTRSKAVRGMTGGLEASPAAKVRVASVIHERMVQSVQDEDEGETTAAAPAAAPDKQKKKRRKVAILLRGMEMEMRDGLIKSLEEQDSENAQAVKDLMVIWDDLPVVAERALQEALRSADSRKLALALVEAEEKTSAKIRENISDRAKSMLEEEESLLSNPKSGDVEQAREDIVKVLREMNDKGELQFEEE